MKFKLKRIDWYIIKQFLGTYIFAIILIISISVVFDINEKIDKFLKPEVPLHAIIFDYYMNFIPYFANLFSPLFTFIAVIFFTSKLADHSEVIAMLASGISFKRLMVPYAISASVIAISTFILNAFVIPPAHTCSLKSNPALLPILTGMTRVPTWDIASLWSISTGKNWFPG